MVAVWSITLHVLHQQSRWNLQRLPLVKANAVASFNVHFITFLHHEVYAEPKCCACSAQLENSSRQIQFQKQSNIKFSRNAKIMSLMASLQNPQNKSQNG